MGDFPGAEALYREALATQKTLLGEKNVEVARSLEGLGLNLFDQDNADDGILLLREAVAMPCRICDKGLQQRPSAI